MQHTFMNDCIFSVPLDAYGLTGVFAGTAIGLLFKYRTALRKPADAAADAQMGWTIVSVCMLAGWLIGVTVQVLVEGCPKGLF